MLRLAKLLAAVAVAAVWISPARATAGFAEWEVYTPGGHLVSHNDVWKEQHGTCLRSDVKPGAGEPTIFVSWIERWRYYPDRVAGRDRDGWFVFDELTGKVARFDDEPALEHAVSGATPQSAWLTGADGWREAWYPFMVWRPCRYLLGLELVEGEEAAAMRRAAGSMYSEAECRAALAPEALALYRSTTWGRTCAAWRAKGLANRPGEESLVSFCEAVGGVD